jgi:hypothetical protein
MAIRAWVSYFSMCNHKKYMNTSESSSANEWNNHHAYVARPLSDYGDSTEDWTNGMTAHQPPVSNRNVQGHLQDRATRLLMAKVARITRTIRE